MSLLSPRLRSSGAFFEAHQIDRERPHEENIPTEPAETLQQTRLPCQDGDPGRPESDRASAREGAEAADGQPRAFREVAFSSVSRRQTLPRSTSLKREAWIRALFDRRRSDVVTVASGCIRILFRIVYGHNTVSRRRLMVGFSAGPRQRSAVRRNRIKRLLRESFRLNQHTLEGCLPQAGILTMMILYRHKELKSFHEIDSDLRRSLDLAAAEMDEDPHYG